MVDNVSISAGTGTSIATDDVGGVHYQITKQAFGALDSATLVTAAVGLPVSHVGALAVTGAFFQATQPVSGTVTVGNASIAVTGTFFQATQPVSIASMPSTPVTGTFFQATQPVSAASLPLPTGAAADATLTGGTAKAISRGGAKGTTAAADVTSVAIDANTQALHTNVTNASLAVTGTFWQATQPVSFTQQALPANQSTNVAQMNGVAVTMGSGVTGTGVQRVVLATDVALPTGANVIGALTANQSVNVGQINAVAPLMGNGVTGTGSQRVTIASDNTAFSVNATPPTLTKGTQGATGYSTQDLKDAGRTLFSACTVIGGVTTVTAEAMLSLVVTRAGVAAAGATTLTVTSGKTLRITKITFSSRSTGATVLSARGALRMQPAAAATVSSPIIDIFSTTQQAAALAEAGDTLTVTYPDGLEFTGTQQIGISQVASAITGAVYVAMTGFEY